MSLYNPQNPSASIPPEIWLQIFQTATYIPGEWDVSVTIPHTGLFTSWDLLQWKAYKVVLPLRRAIVQVSRLWWEVGTEVLYASFHETVLHGRIPTRALDHFERSLSSHPALGRFVKRLALLMSDSGQIDHVLQLCPNNLILSFYHTPTPYHYTWEPVILTGHIRILDTSVLSFSQKEIVQVLSSLANLEILHLSRLDRGPEESRYHGTLRLSLVRLLRLSFQDLEGVEYWTPLLSTTDLPRLTAFSKNLGRGLLPFPIDIWRRITFFGCSIEIYDSLESETFRSLTHLHLRDSVRPLRRQQSRLPFHQLHQLTIANRSISFTRVAEWKQIAEGCLELPLSRSEMPLLRVLELEWGADGIGGNFVPISEYRQYLAFLKYLESATLDFERLGVQFQEVYRKNIYRMPTPIKHVIKNVREEMRI